MRTAGGAHSWKDRPGGGNVAYTPRCARVHGDGRPALSGGSRSRHDNEELCDELSLNPMKNFSRLLHFRLPLSAFLILSWVAYGSHPRSAAADDSPGELKLYPHVFSYHADDSSPHHVVVVGDFNGWSHDATPMTRKDNGIFSVSIEMTEGVHLYKFMVDGKWVNDPHSDPSLEQPDGFGGKNSAIVVGPDARQFPPPPPGQIVAALLRHDVADVHDRNVVSSHQLRLGLRAQ